MRKIIITVQECKKLFPKRKLKFNWRIGPTKTKKRNNMVEIVLTNEEQVKVTLKPVTRGDKPAGLDGKPTWTVASGTCTVIPSEDGMSADIVSGANPGDSEIVVSADADLGEGVVTVSDAIKVTVEGARATSLGLEVGDPTEKVVSA